MFIIQYLPDFVTHLIVLIGLAGFLVTSVPFLWNLVPGAKLYQLPLKILSVVVLGYGLYLEGGIATEAVWKEKVRVLETRVTELKKKSEQIKIETIIEYRDRISVVKQKGDTVIKYIGVEVAKYDKTCPLPPEVSIAHNAAAKGETINLNLTPDLSSVPTELHNTLAKPPKLTTTIKLVPKK